MTDLAGENLSTIDEAFIHDKVNTYGFLDLDILISKIRDDFAKAGFNFMKVYEKYKDNDINKYRMALIDGDKALGFAQTYTMELADHAALIYNSLDGLGQKKIREKYLDIIEAVVTKTPRETMEDIIRDFETANLSIIRGTESIKVDKDCKFIGKSSIGDQVSLDVIINAQGFENDLTKAIEKDTLLKNLYKRKFIYPDDGNKFIRLTYPSYNLLSKEYGKIDRMYLSGMWAGSTDIHNNDLRSILKASELMANDFMDSL